MTEITDRDKERFLSQVDKLPNGCWFWCGARSRGKGNKKWYGSFWCKALGTIRAHRFSLKAFKGQDCPPGHDRSHLCHFSMCVNPDHLVIELKTTNQARKSEKHILSV